MAWITADGEPSEWMSLAMRIGPSPGVRVRRRRSRVVGLARDMGIEDSEMGAVGIGKIRVRVVVWRWRPWVGLWTG